MSRLLRARELVLPVGLIASILAILAPLPAALMHWDCRNNRLAWQGLQADGFLGAVEAARERFDAILIDAPPVLEFPDALKEKLLEFLPADDAFVKVLIFSERSTRHRVFRKRPRRLTVGEEIARLQRIVARLIGHLLSAGE